MSFKNNNKFAETLQLITFTVSFFICLIPALISESPISNILLITICILGVILGVFSVNKSQEDEFLKSAAVFILASIFVLPYIKNLFGSNLAYNTLVNFTILFGVIGITFTFTKLLSILQINDSNSLSSDFSSLSKKDSHFDFKIWDSFIYVLIIFLIVIICFDLFLGSSHVLLFNHIYLVYNMVFIIDLGVIYYRKRSLKRMFKENLIDIISAIPFYSIFRFFKILKVLKLLRFAKFNSALKMTSNESQFSRSLLKRKKE